MNVHLNSLDLKTDAFMFVFAIKDNIAVDVIDCLDVLRHHRCDLISCLDRVVLLLKRKTNVVHGGSPHHLII